ncbi:MAG: RNA polymerase sigma factor [Planctomycetota bacterium]|jgi:RNA polymerase sigma-70 factor (ECF subfamily)
MADTGETNTTSDSELISACLHGDRDCFGILVERYWKMALATALSRIGDPVRAEDVAQESFIRAFGQLDGLRDPTRFAGWLMKIVSQKCVDHIRSNKRLKLVSIADVPEPELNASPAVGCNPGLAQEHRDFIRRIVSRLPEKFRCVIIMRFIGGLSTAEIARQLGKRPNTVRVWLHRAYKKLRDDLVPLLAEVRADDL